MWFWYSWEILYYHLRYVVIKDTNVINITFSRIVPPAARKAVPVPLKYCLQQPIPPQHARQGWRGNGDDIQSWVPYQIYSTWEIRFPTHILVTAEPDFDLSNACHKSTLPAEEPSTGFSQIYWYYLSIPFDEVTGDTTITMIINFFFIIITATNLCGEGRGQT